MFRIIRIRYTALALAGALLFLSVAVMVNRRFTAVATGGTGWGLSFHTDGQPPVGNTSPAALRRYNAWFCNDTTDQKVLYLTFDAGYENGCMPSILDTLRRHQVPAAFFVVGHYLQSEPDLVRRMIDEGHIVGNHTFHHPDMSAIDTPEAFAEELTSLETLYTDVTGQTLPKFYRPPQGIYSEANLKMAQELGYATVFWSLAYVDWNTDDQPTAQQAFDKLLPRVHPGAVVLLHSTSQTNAAILDELLTRWKADGYTFGTLYDLTGQTSPAATPS